MSVDDISQVWSISAFGAEEDSPGAVTSIKVIIFYFQLDYLNIITDHLMSDTKLWEIYLSITFVTIG